MMRGALLFLLTLGLVAAAACTILGGGYGAECATDDDCGGDLVCSYGDNSCGAHGRCGGYMTGGGAFCEKSVGCDCSGRDITWAMCRGAPVPIRWQGFSCDAGARDAGALADGGFIIFGMDSGASDAAWDVMESDVAAADGDAGEALDASFDAAD